MTRKSRFLFAVAVCCGLVIGGLGLFLFRDSSADLPGLGRAKMKYRWGKPRLLRIDRNRDGAFDYRASLSGNENAWFVPPDEVWVDDDYDGVFEAHFTLGRGTATRAAFDRDGDGRYELEYNGYEAEKLYLEWRSRWFEETLTPDELRLHRWDTMSGLIAHAGTKDGLQFEVDGGQVTTVGMAKVSYPELTIVVPQSMGVEIAQKILVGAANQSFDQGKPLADGQLVNVEGFTLEAQRNEDGRAELVFLDPP